MIESISPKQDQNESKSTYEDTPASNDGALSESIKNKDNSSGIRQRLGKWVSKLSFAISLKNELGGREHHPGFIDAEHKIYEVSPEWSTKSETKPGRIPQEFREVLGQQIPGAEFWTVTDYNNRTYFVRTSVPDEAHDALRSSQDENASITSRIDSCRKVINYLRERLHQQRKKLASLPDAANPEHTSEFIEEKAILSMIAAAIGDYRTLRRRSVTLNDKGIALTFDPAVGL